MDIRNWFPSIKNKNIIKQIIINDSIENKFIVTKEQIKNDKIFIYTDGSCFKNGKKNVPGGIGIYIPSLNINISEKIPNATNNIAELKAIIRAIEIINSRNISKIVIIYTDSQYSIKCCTQWIKKWIWDPVDKIYKKKGRNKKMIDVKNSQLIRIIVDYLSKNRKIWLKHIKAHTSK